MNVADIISRVKRTFGDESGTQITDDDIIRWINDAQNEIAQTVKLFETTGTQTTVAGTNDYFLPDTLIDLRAVYVDGRHLQYLAEREFDEYIRKVNAGTEASPGYPTYYTSWGNKITLYPGPGANSSLEIRFICFPIQVAATTDDLPLPMRYHNRILEMVLASAHELDENYEAYQTKYGQFANNLSAQLGDEDWDGKSEYPRITVLVEDY